MAKQVLPAIQGTQAASIYEVYVANSLTKFGWPYEYQYPVMGGRNLLGGQVIDFLVQTRPRATALYVQGPYYHGSAQEQKDTLLQTIAFGVLHYQVEVLPTDTIETQDLCDSTILKLFGRSN